MLEMTFTRIEPIIDRQTNNVISFIIGAVGRDTEKGLSEYIVVKENVPENNLKNLSQWTNDEIRQFCVDTSVKYDFYTKLALKIDSRFNEPIIGQNISGNI